MSRNKVTSWLMEQLIDCVRFDLFKTTVLAHEYVFIALPEILGITKKFGVVDYDLVMTCQPPSFDQLKAFTINEVEGR